MLKWAPYPLVRVTLGFIAGILLYIYWGKEFRYTYELFAFFISVYGVALVAAKRIKSTGITNLAGIAGVLCFVAGGMAMAKLRTTPEQPQHISKLASPPTHYVGVVDDYVVQKPGYQSTVLSLEQVQVDGVWQHAEGKVQLSVPHDSERAYELSYGDRLLVKGTPQTVASPANPAQFNYQDFLANKQIYYRQSLQSHQFSKLGSDPPNLVLYHSIQLRRKLDSILRAQVGERREYGISSALVLGVKDELDNSIRSAYANTGTMHVLAVSGLHVGLLYLVLMFFFGRLNRSTSTRILSAAILLTVLWLYAFMTGMSPSVLRAVVMFSLVTVALAMRRGTNIYNTLAFAAFVLLLINPYYLFEVSFQLSFVAVLGIVYLQPRFYKLLEFDSMLADKVWKLFTVSLAAQVATLPLGLYYFHQFPVYFWLANLLIVPAAILTLWSGMAALAFSWVPVLGQLLFMLHTSFIWCMNEFNLLLTSLPNAVINGISINALQAWLLYAILLSLVLFFAIKRLRFLGIAVALVAVITTQVIARSIAQQEQKALIVYSMRGNTAMAFIEGQKAVLLADAEMPNKQDAFNYNIQPHLWQRGIKDPQWQALHTATEGTGISHALLPDSNSLYVWQGQRLLVLSRPLKVQANEPLQVDYILLTNNARVKPEELQQFRYNQLLLDASNAPWYLQQKREQLKALDMPFYDIAASGAFVVELE